MRTIDLILTCVGTAMNLFLAYPMFDCLWAKKKHVKLPLLLLLASAVLYTLCLLAFGGSAVQPFFGLLPLLALTLRFEAKAWQRILFCTVFFAVACTSQLMVELVCDLFIPLKYIVPTYLLYSLQVTLLSKSLVFAFVAGVCIKQKSAVSAAAKKYYLLIPLFLLASVAILVLQYYVFPDFPIETQSLLIVVAICFTLLIVASILVFVFLDLLSQNQIGKQHLAAANEIISRQIAQYQALITHHKDIAKMRHDHKNFCIGMLSELEHGNVQAVIGRLREECAALQSPAERSGDIIHTVVELKSELAKRQGISVDFEYRELRQMVIPPIDLAVILGNALDNAIEATAAVKKDATKTVSVLVACKNNTIVISIKNPVGRKLDTACLTTQKPDAAHHGFGILSMQSLAAKYGGEVIFDCTENMFTVSIVLNNFPSKTEPYAPPTV